MFTFTEAVEDPIYLAQDDIESSSSDASSDTAWPVCSADVQFTRDMESMNCRIHYLASGIPFVRTNNIQRILDYTCVACSWWEFGELKFVFPTPNNILPKQ